MLTWWFVQLNAAPVFENGDFLTRQYLAAFLDLALPGIPGINTHSFRIGGASAALTAGLLDALIRIMGRWSSDSYQKYLRIADATDIDFNTRMGRTSSVTSLWSLP